MEMRGLTPEQAQMLDIMWSMDTREELLHWIDNLTTLREKKMAHTLLILIVYEGLDEAVSEMESYPQAVEVLDRFML